MVPCPTHIKPVEQLDVQRYKGVWYEMYRRKSDKGEKGECTRALYGDHPDGKSISVWNMEWYGEKPN